MAKKSHQKPINLDEQIDNLIHLDLKIKSMLKMYLRKFLIIDLLKLIVLL